MALANKKMRARIEELLKGAIAADETPADFKAAAQEWLEGKDDADASKAAAGKLVPMIEAGKAAGCPACAKLSELAHYLQNAASGLSVATVPLTISATVVWTTSSLRVKMSISSYWIPKYIPTPVASLPRQPCSVPLPSLPLP